MQFVMCFRDFINFMACLVIPQMKNYSSNSVILLLKGLLFLFHATTTSFSDWFAALLWLFNCFFWAQFYALPWCLWLICNHGHRCLFPRDPLATTCWFDGDKLQSYFFIIFSTFLIDFKPGLVAWFTKSTNLHTIVVFPLLFFCA